MYVHTVSIHITKYGKVSPKGHTNNGNDTRKESDPLCLEVSREGFKREGYVHVET